MVDTIQCSKIKPMKKVNFPNLRGENVENWGGDGWGQVEQRNGATGNILNPEGTLRSLKLGGGGGIGLKKPLREGG